MTPFENFCVGLLDLTVAGGGHAWVLTFVIYAPEDTPRYQRNGVLYGYNTLKQYYAANPCTGPRTPHNVNVLMLPSGLGYIKVLTHIGKNVITQDQDWSNERERLRVSDIVERGGEIEQIVEPNALIVPDIETRLAVVDPTINGIAAFLFPHREYNQAATYTLGKFETTVTPNMTRHRVYSTSLTTDLSKSLMMC
ncbi:hypothetical protein PANT_24c00034 [Moesziomyces antarcticus T-34]|uniref:Uncharacterized protein n=1 Tax=Pseudozyma antarctica (strain T-34) TaxID=1151754 RepID=M9M7J2_PSEA3|nr:hypothetical protein PANT_24c00034 [Moesziomyces antarcticus T-34]